MVLTTLAASLPRWDRPEDAGFSSSRLQRLHDDMRREVDGGVLPGISMMVARHGRVVDVLSCGARDLEAGKAIEPDTIFRWHSLTKAATGMAMMLLYEQGAWRFEDPVAAFLPEVAGMEVFTGVDGEGTPMLEPLERPILMRDLLGHQAGFAYGIGAGAAQAHVVDDQYRHARVLDFDAGVSRLVSRATSLPLVAQPGTRFHYSVAQDFCGAIIERLSAQSLGVFMREKLFAPLGMVDTGFSVPPADRSRLAALYAHDAGGQPRVAADTPMLWDVTRPPALESGGGGLVGTLTDCWCLAEFVAGRQVNGSPPLLAPGTHRLALTPLHRDVPTGFGNERGIGYAAGGVYVMDDPARVGSPLSPGSLSAAGASGGWFNVDPQTGVVIVGLMSVLGWSHGTPPGYRAETLVCQALTTP